MDTPAIRSSRRILVGLDGSDAAAEALRWAAWQSQHTGATVVAVHAYEPAAGGAVADSAEFRQVQESLVRSQATGWYREALSTSAALPHRTRLEVHTGRPDEVLARLATPVDLLVVGRPGPASDHAGLATLDAGCPLVVVPASVTATAAAETLEQGATRAPSLA